MKKLIYLIVTSFFLLSCDKDSGSAGDLASVGQGGSLARFAIIKDHLYAVNGTRLKTFSISNLENPVYLSNQNVGVDVETIFPRDDSTLFIGSTQGMYIYDVGNAPAVNYLSHYEHVLSCDPVVADHEYAYVTLRSSVQNNFCNRNINQLDIIDVRNLHRPEHIISVPMIHPVGLAIYGDTLLICDNGVKVYDVNNPLELKLLNAIENIAAVDIIPVSDLMIIVTETGLSQYRYHNKQLTLLSSIR